MVTTTSTKIELQAECMDGKFGYSTLPQLAYWNCTCAAVRGSPLLLALLAAAVAAGGSLLSAGLIIWAMSGWVCLSRRIRVISRVNAAGLSTSAFASANGLSRTIAMSISPPSLWIIVGRPACTSARIATALFSHKVRSHSSKALCARVSVCGGALRAAVVPNALRKGLSGGRGMGDS